MSIITDTTYSVIHVLKKVQKNGIQVLKHHPWWLGGVSSESISEEKLAVLNVAD